MIIYIGIIIVLVGSGGGEGGSNVKVFAWARVGCYWGGEGGPSYNRRSHVWECQFDFPRLVL